MRTTMMVLGCVVMAASTGCFSSGGMGMAGYNARLKAQQDTVNPIPDTARAVSPPPSFIRGYAKVDDWEMERNARGVITGREADAVIFYKGGQSGFCRMEHVKLHEDNQGGQHWGKPTLYSIGVYGKQGILTMGFHVDCNDINGLPPDPA